MLLVEGENSITVGSLCQFVYTVHLTAEEPSPQALKASQKNQKVEDKDDKDVVFAHAPCWPGVSPNAVASLSLCLLADQSHAKTAP